MRLTLLLIFLVFPAHAADPLVREVEGGDRVVLEDRPCEAPLSVDYLGLLAEGVEYRNAVWLLREEERARTGLAGIMGCWRENRDGYFMLFDDKTMYLAPKDVFRAQRMGLAL